MKCTDQVQTYYIKYNFLFNSAEFFPELKRGLTALANRYKTAEARKILTEAIPLVFVIEKYIEGKDSPDSRHVIQVADKVFSSTFDIERKHGGGIAADLSKKFASETEALQKHHAKTDAVLAWMRTQRKALRDGLNHGKPF